MKPDDYDLTQRVPPELEAVHVLLENWARWSRDRIRQGHCRSIEWHYKSSDIWNNDEPRQEWDSLDAEEMHGLVCALPEKSRWIVHLHYIHKAPVQFVRRKLALTRDGFVIELNRARRMVKNSRK